MRWSVRYGQEGTQEKFRETKCVIIITYRARQGHVRNAKFCSGGPRQGPGQSLNGVFWGAAAGEARQDRINSLGLATVNNFERL